VRGHASGWIARGARRHVVVTIWAAALAGCASAPAPRTQAEIEAAGSSGFELAGRLSARSGDAAATANFRWTHRSDRDELVLSTPLGQTLAHLDGDPARVRLELPDGRIAQAPDWEALTSEALGVPIPVRGLAWWVRGLPRPGAEHSIDRDADARIAVLRQDGWEIVYSYGGAGALASRLRLAVGEVEIRLALDSFGALPPHSSRR
jgi:outer membrane lipoprotein LolB